MRKRLGECLVQAGLITEEQLRSSLAEQKHTREPLGVILTRRGTTTESQIAQTVALQLGLPFVNLAHHEPDPATLSLIPQGSALQHASIGLTLQRHVLTVAMADPLLLGFVQDLESRTGYRVRQVVAARGDITDFIARAYTSSPRRSNPATAADDDEGLFDADNLLAEIVEQAQEPGITEVRLEPSHAGGTVWRRTGGTIETVAAISRADSDALLSRLKQRACMDPEERALAQDGRLRISGSPGEMRTIRVATRRVPGGEVAVLRRESNEVTLALTALGLSPLSLDALRRLASRSGLLLVSAPPAGGASTSARSIAAASSLSAVGDIDDVGSVGAALSAAREGSVIVATLQADDTGTAVDRLVGLSWSPGLVAEVLTGVVAQRLTRRLCDRCRRPSTSAEGFEAGACAQCGYTGYRGRVGIFEVLDVASERRHLIAQGGSALRGAAISDGMVTLADDATWKVRAGLVRFADAFRTVPGVATARRTCPGCSSVVDEDATACSYCGQRLLAACASCGKTLKPEWGACPYCTRSVAPGTLLERLS